MSGVAIYRARRAAHIILLLLSTDHILKMTSVGNGLRLKEVEGGPRRQLVLVLVLPWRHFLVRI